MTRRTARPERSSTGWSNGTAGAPLLYEVLAHSPTVVTARETYFSFLRTEGTVRRETKEFVYLVVSVANECEYCSVRHDTLFTERFWNDPTEVAAVREGRFSDLPAGKRAVAAFTDRVACDPKTVSNAELDALRSAGYDDEGIVELLAVAAAAVAANTIVDALSVRLEDA